MFSWSCSDSWSSLSGFVRYVGRSPWEFELVAWLCEICAWEPRSSAIFSWEGWWTCVTYVNRSEHCDFGWFWMILVSPMETFVWLIKNCQICLLTGFFTNQSSYAEPIHKGLWKFSFYLQAQGPGAVSEKTCMTQVCWELTLCFTWNTRRLSYQVGRCTKPEIPLGSSQVFSDQTHMLVLVICLFTYATYKLLIFDDMC